MKHYCLSALVLFISMSVCSNNLPDSLVRFSDLSFHSEFEKQAFINIRQGNEFDLCMATDKNMTAEKMASLKANFDQTIKQLSNGNLTAKNIRQKFKDVHKIIFYKSQMQYVPNAEFSDILNNGYFNYVTSSILYSLVLKQLNIPSYYLFTLSKTDIILNPNADQIILETQNQKDENGYFNSSDNKGYIVNLLDKNIRIGSEYQYNSNQGNSVVRFKDSEVLKTNQLAATIYFYKAVNQLTEKNTDEAYRLISKACYLYPDETFVNSMFVILDSRLQACKFDKVEDVDLLGQLSRFRNNNFDYIKRTFWNLIGNKVANDRHNLGFQTDLPFCTTAYKRLLPQINDVLLADEISYAYYMGAAFCSDFNRVNLEPAIQALKLKPNDKPALSLLETNLHRLSDYDENKEALLDTLTRYEKELNSPESLSLIKNTKMFMCLDVAKKYFMRNKLKEGLQYIAIFESEFKLPLPNLSFKINIENTYYEYAMYYNRFNNKSMAQKVVNKGLEYVPNSNMIESATYKMPVVKPIITHRKMNKAEYDKYMKKNKL
jgi:hypothetical protein